MLHRNRIRSRSYILLYVCVILLVPFSFNCIETPNDFKAPTWTTQLTIPLIDRTYFFGDIIRKDSKFDTTATGEVVYRPSNLENKPSKITIPNLTPVSASFVRQLGLIPISSVTLPAINLTFQQLTGQAPPGVPWPGPEISANQNRAVIGDTASYDYLIYEEGQMTLTITNTFPFDVSFAPGGIQMVDTTVVPNVTIGTFSIGTVIKNGGSATAVISLNGKKVSSVLRMRFPFQTIDLTGKTVTASQNISATIVITRNGTGNPTLSEAKMKLLNEFYLPVTSIRDSVQPIDDSIFIKTADFSGGDFNIRINNGIPFDIVIEFNLRELVEKQTNSSFRLRNESTQLPSDSISITGGNLYNQSYDLRNYRMEARRSNGATDTLTRGMHFSLAIKTLIRTTTKKVIRKSDSVVVQLLPKQIGNVVQPYVINEVTGKIPPTSQPISQSFSSFSLGSSDNKFSASEINFEDVAITLKVFSRSLFPTDLNMTVAAVRNNQPFGVPLISPPGTGINQSPDGVSYRIFPGDTASIVFSKSNGSNIDQFLSNIVDANGKISIPTFNVTGSALLMPKDAYESTNPTDPRYSGTVKNNDSIYTSVGFAFPLKIGIVNGSYKDTASIADNIPDTVQLNLIEEGKVFFDIISTFPVGLVVRTKLLKANPFDSSKASTDTVFSMLPLRVDGRADANGKGLLDSSYTFITISNDQAARLGQAAFTAVDIELNTANGSTPVRFSKEDSIVVRSSANIKFKVDIDRLTNK